MLLQKIKIKMQNWRLRVLIYPSGSTNKLAIIILNSCGAIAINQIDINVNWRYD